MADQEIERLRVGCVRLDEALAGLEWALSNNPEAFPLLDGTKLRMAPIAPAPDVPEIRIWFTFDDRTVNVLCAEEYEEDDG